MKMFENEVADWIQSGQMEDGCMKIAAYADNIVMVCLEGKSFHLPGEWPGAQWHVGLQLFSGELHLTANDNRLGFEAPMIIDFILEYNWKDIRLINGFCACILIIKQEFFLDSVLKLRPKIAEMMLYFSKNPFVQLKKDDAYCLQQLNNALFASMSMKNKLLQQEQIQMLLCAGQCEMWNAVFNQRDLPRAKNDPLWNDTMAHFLYLLNFYFREQHEVRWYAAQLGCSSDALSAKLKRMYGKNASMLLNERLITEAKVLLQRPEHTIQHVAETLYFSDQSAFGKFFKRHCGMSPMQYREQVGKTKGDKNARKKETDKQRIGTLQTQA